MSITRRHLLTNAGFSLPASALVSTRAMSIGEDRQSASNTMDDWSVVRNQFNLSREYIHLATFALASHPRPVRDAIQKYRRALDENPFLVVDRGLWGSEAENLPHKVREAAAVYVGGRSEEIALTGNTTMGLALVYCGLPLKPGQVGIHLADNPQADTPAELCRRKLKVLADRLDQFHAFAKGQFVRWKTGLKNRKFPDYGEPAIVTVVS